ncbi:MAG: spermidine/putrescine ABC transporter substrate-binding protein [Deltaproteobacteria bacterium]|nr:spermidine/putrescine ABC transporter substrate-binding protein [Candidatus Zymogenaceae bacterium]
MKGIFARHEGVSLHFFTALISIFMVLCSILIGGCSFCGNKEQRLSDTLTVLNWEDYIEMGVVRSFEKEFGVKVIIRTFASEDEMISMVLSDPGKYDLAVTSESIVKTITDMGLIAPIDKKNIPNISGIDPDISNTPGDPLMQFSVPYLWGTSGIAVNRRYVTADVIDWGILFDRRYANRIDMLNDIQENFAPALKMIGCSINARDKQDLTRAQNILKKQRLIIRGYFDSQEIQEHLLDGSTYIAFLYSGDSLMVAQENPDIEYVVPPSGAPIWLDSWVIPATSKNKNTAEAFINYILKPENIATISNYVWYANAVSSSNRYLNSELLESRSIYLPAPLLARCEYYLPLDETTNQFFNKLWYELLR